MNKYVLILYWIVSVLYMPCAGLKSASERDIQQVKPRSSLELTSMAKFCANLAFLFQEIPFLERYTHAKNAGFKAVETGFPYGYTKEQVANAKNEANIEQVLINIYTGIFLENLKLALVKPPYENGDPNLYENYRRISLLPAVMRDVTKGELGFAAIPGKEKEFQNSLTTTIDYAKAVGARKIHIMAGNIEHECTVANDLAYENNLIYAVKLLEKENILGLIEPINPYSVPKYYMNSYQKALSVLKKINSPNLKLMLDIFHLQLIQGNITNTVKELKEYIGHVQIAQAPLRNEPDTEGEIDYRCVLKMLKQEGYDGWIGLEYKPKQSTSIGLKWIEDFDYHL